MNKKINFAIDHYNVLTQDDTDMILECYIVHPGENRKGTSFSLEGIKNAIPSLANRPLLISWDYGKNDFTDHAEYDRDGLTYIGNIPESNNAEIVKFQGKEFLKTRCIIWGQYHPNVVRRFTDNESAKISMEIDVSKYYTDESTGVLHIEDFVFTGICLLGDNPKYREGIKDAHIKVINFTDDKLKETIEYYNDKYCDMTNDYIMVPDSIADVLKYQVTQPQKNYSILQFCKYIIEKKFIPYSTVTEWYSKLIGTRKLENFNYYGGKEAEKYLMDTIKNHAVSEEDVSKNEPIEPNHKELESGGDEKMEKEKYAMDYGDLMQLLSKMLQEQDSDEYGYPIYNFYGCREEYVVASKNVGGKYEFVKMPYSIGESDKINIDFANQIKVHPKMEYIELGNAQEEDMVSENMNSLYTAIVDANTKYNIKSLEFTDIYKQVEDLTEENINLKQYKEDAILADKIRVASDVYKKYSDQYSITIDEESKEDLNKILYDTSKTIEDFKLAVNAIVLPIMEVRYSELQTNGTKSNINIDKPNTDKSNKTEPLKLNHSNIPSKLETNSTNDGRKWLKEYLSNPITY